MGKRVLVLIALLALMALPPFVFAQDELSETYDDNGITFNYPEDWAVCEDCLDLEGALVFANDEDAFDGRIRRGEVRGVMVSDVSSFLNELDVTDGDLDEDLTSEEVLEDYFLSGSAFDWSRIRTVDNDEIAWAQYANDEDDTEGMYVVRQMGEGQFIFVSMLTPSGELDEVEDIALAMARSVELGGSNDRAGRGGDTQRYEDDLITFEFPDDWVDCGCPPEDNTVIVANVRRSLNSLEDLRDGDVQVLVVKDGALFLDQITDGDVEWDFDLSLEEALEAYFTGTSRDVDYDRARDMEFNGNEAIARRYINNASGFEGIWIMIDMGRDQVVIISAIAREGSLDDYEDAIFALAETIEIP